MFQRREKRGVLSTARQFFWPSMGYLRYFTYIKHRIIRVADSSHRIALGLSFGAAISFTPIVGTHFIQAGLLAYFFRANMLSSLIGTFVGNPWTFPFMWLLSIEFGSVLFNLMGLPADKTLPSEMNLSIFWDIATSEPLRILAPWALGGYLIALISIPITYYIFKNLVSGAKLARKKAREFRIHQAAKRVTGQKK